MKNAVILTFDCGTQSMRGLIFDTKGNLLQKEQIAFLPYHSPEPGWGEQDADFYFDKICEISKALKKSAPALMDELSAVTITTIRDTAISLDRNLEPLRPAILWLDKRLAKCEKPFPLLVRLAYLASGMTNTANVARRESHANWIRENQPEIWEKTHKYVMLSAYLTYRLTGNLVDSVANQIGHIPMQCKHRRWMKPSNFKFDVFGIEEHMLPDLVEPGEMVGKITKQAAEHTGIKEGLPVIATGSDKGCETLGTGCIDGTKGSLSFGTTSTIQIVTHNYVEPQTFMPAYPAVIAGQYNPEIEIYRGYWMVTWFKNEFANREQQEADQLGIPVEKVLEKRLEQIPPGADGLFLLPYWGPGLKKPEAKGAIIGFRDTHTRAHVYRAIIEGINFSLREGLLSLQKRAGFQVKELTVSGGGSESDVICAITADMFGIPVLRVQTHETSALGSSIAGFVGLGEFKDIKEAVGQMVQYTSRFEPDAKQHQVYDMFYHTIYKDLYSQIKPTYQKLFGLYHK